MQIREEKPWLVEDGFLRSAGLGAEFHAPLSLVFDSEGIYYDCTAPCDLESILRERKFSAKEIAEVEIALAKVKADAAAAKKAADAAAKRALAARFAQQVHMVVLQ